LLGLVIGKEKRDPNDEKPEEYVAKNEGVMVLIKLLVTNSMLPHARDACKVWTRLKETQKYLTKAEPFTSKDYFFL
jgi:hypothetical protein